MSRLFPWYDSIWLSQYVAVKAYLAECNPRRLPDFISALAPLKTRSDFRVLQLGQVLDNDEVSQIKALAASLPLEKLELHEMRGFGRFVVQDHAALRDLESSMIRRVSECAGEDVEISYSFLSLYTKLGKCPVHMDAPFGKWMVDVCIEQSEPWPIHLSQVVAWPEDFSYEGKDWSERIIRDPGHVFTSYTLDPGHALMCSASSQWHYRESLARPGGSSFATILMFHFIPRGTRDLAQPRNWAGLFGVPALAQITGEVQHAASEQLVRRERR
jgi:hypothetical protein